MNYSILILVVVAGVLGGVVVFFLFERRSRDQNELGSKIGSLEKLVTEELGKFRESLGGSFERSSHAMHETIRSFTQATTELRDAVKQVEGRVHEVSSFQEIFKSPKLRGAWGEASLEHILTQHYPRELYEVQYSFVSGERVDACLKLPDGRIVPIDAKFPSENFAKMVESPNDTERLFYKKNFISDVKARIDEIATKYILPSEGTIDFALMFVPAEAVYYEMINHIAREVDLAGYASEKRVIITSPNTLFLTLKTIEHWFKDVQVSRETQNILKRLARVKTDAEKLADDFRKLGRHLSDARSAYEGSEKRLGMMVDHVDTLAAGNNGERMLDSQKKNLA
ncbi:MAG: DNA recombination protein RmuC [Parcubacteria group bacterium]|nr:DNA recombination protein RmuC [Parcubacteria group bacterium]